MHEKKALHMPEEGAKRRKEGRMIFEKTLKILDHRRNDPMIYEAISELKNAEKVVQAAIAVVKSPAYAGICDEDIDLENALRQGRFI